jgi:hypothetical protein
MTHIPYLFNQTIEQMRHIGARGGRSHARNWRARHLAAGAGPRETITSDTPPQETTTQAMAVPDAQIRLVTRRRECLPTEYDSRVAPRHRLIRLIPAHAADVETQAFNGW